MTFFLFTFLAVFVNSAALADAPVIWSGSTVKWLPSALQVAGMCKTDANGTQTAYTTDGIIKMSSGVPAAAASGTDYAPATSGAAVLSGNGSGGFTNNTSTGSGNVVFSSAPTLTNPIVGTQSADDNSTKAASTAYVDLAVRNEGPAKDASDYATTAALASVLYANGSSGVGATLTAVAFGALSIDGASPTVGQRLLVKNQASTLQNGIYTVTAVGSVGAVFVLTRATDYDQAAEAQVGSSTFIVNGTTNGATVWDQNSATVATMGTDAITFAQTAGPGSFTVGSFSSSPSAKGLTITGTAINMDPADATNPGGVSTTTQTFAGAKTFSGAVTHQSTVTNSVSGAASTPAVNNSGTPFAGTATTSKALTLWEWGSPTTNNWDTVGNVLGINQASGGTANFLYFQVNAANVYKATFQGGFTFWNTNDFADYRGSPTMCNGTANPASNANCTSLYQSGGQVFNIYSPNATQGATNMLRFSTTIGNAAFGGATPSSTGWLLVQSANFAAYNARNTLEVMAKSSQTGDLQQWQNSSATALGKVDINGKLFVPNIRDTAFLAAGVVTNDASGDFSSVAPGPSGNVLTSNGSAWGSSTPSAGGCVAPVLSKTADYTISTSDFTCANKVLWVKCGCTSDCTMTLPAASNSGFEARIVNTGTATCTVAAAGSDTIYNTTETSVILPPGGTPPSSVSIGADGGTLWLGF